MLSHTNCSSTVSDSLRTAFPCRLASGQWPPRSEGKGKPLSLSGQQPFTESLNSAMDTQVSELWQVIYRQRSTVLIRSEKRTPEGHGMIVAQKVSLDVQVQMPSLARKRIDSAMQTCEMMIWGSWEHVGCSAVSPSGIDCLFQPRAQPR